ncbi:transglutaminaseTgpA domain-containing protein [Brachybacterium sp. AOP43-C2-M15]|uniref:transglutaminaseTgpA domain-containing protein n=1 Tax=Brachybacterium sp. AOP43-C2-M15 TaxID=3457661 RepID=UPI00403464E6
MSPLMGRPSLEGRDLTVRALLLLVAMLLASAPVSQLLAGSSWLLLTLTTAAPVILGGIVLRTVLRHKMLVPLAQAGLIVVLVLVVELSQGLTSWQDGPVALVRDQGRIIAEGGNELASGLAPLTLGAYGTVIVVTMIALVALLLDLMFLDLGWHTPTGLVLMASLLVPALQQPAGGPWWNVAAPILAGALILATRTVHADPRYLRGDRRPQAGPLADPSRTLTVSALCVALIAVGTPLLAPVLPQLAPTRIALNIDVLNRWQDPAASAPGPVMIDDDVSVRRSLLQQEDTEVLRYTTTAEDPSYFRMRTLNTFDGETFRGNAEGEELALGLAAFSDARDDGVPARGSADDFIETDVEIRSLTGDRLPVPDNVRSIEGTSREVGRAITLQPSNGEIALSRVRSGLVGQSYQILSEPSTAGAEELRAVDPAVFEQPFDVGYTSREEVPDIAAELAAEVAEEAGTDNAFDTAVAYQDYFRSTFAYSLTVNTGLGEDPLESFLEDRIGYCEQFAATFALMMTAQGYPSRVVIGFTAGEADGDQRTVTAKNAHAWPEVWFGPEHGWVRFEPTPAAAANGVDPPGVTEDRGQDEETAPTPEEPEEAEETTDEEGTTEEGTTEDDTTEDSEAAEDSDGGEIGPSEETVNRIEGGLVSLLALGALLAAGAAAAVILIRRRRVLARDERWAALLVGGGGGGAGDGGAGGGGAGGGGQGSVGGAGTEGAEGGAGSAGAGSAGGSAEAGGGAPGGSAGAALAAERMHRRAGELAWSELTAELSVREFAIRWIGITGAWGRPPTRIALDPALPPQRALEDLLDQIDAGEPEVTPDHRAAAARIAEAYTAARYAAPLPDQALASPAVADPAPEHPDLSASPEPSAPSAPSGTSVPSAPSGTSVPSAPSGTSVPSEPVGTTEPVPSAGQTGGNLAVNTPTSPRSAADGSAERAQRAPQPLRVGGDAERPMHPLRRDSDRIIELIRTAR